MAKTSNALGAQVIAHPSAAVEPVKNIRWYGRYPNSVTSLRTFKMRREWRQRKADREQADAETIPPTPAEELRSAERYSDTCEYLWSTSLIRLRRAQQLAGVTMPGDGEVVYLMRKSSAPNHYYGEG